MRHNYCGGWSVSTLTYWGYTKYLRRCADVRCGSYQPCRGFTGRSIDGGLRMHHSLLFRQGQALHDFLFAVRNGGHGVAQGSHQVLRRPKEFEGAREKRQEIVQAQVQAIPRAIASARGAIGLVQQLQRPVLAIRRNLIPQDVQQILRIGAKLHPMRHGIPDHTVIWSP